MEKPEFKPFQSISRLKRNCTITCKIDGTNGLIWWDDELTTMFVGSRNRWITPEDDNYGFARWAYQNQEDLKKLGPGSHFGEWWGSGIQRRYGLDEKRFSLFNTSRWSKDGVKIPEAPDCCHVVPVLYEGVFSTEAVDAVLNKLATEGSVAAPGFMNPEGCVVYLQASRSLFKVTLGGDGHKTSKAM